MNPQEVTNLARDRARFERLLGCSNALAAERPRRSNSWLIAAAIGLALGLSYGFGRVHQMRADNDDLERIQASTTTHAPASHLSGAGDSFPEVK